MHLLFVFSLFRYTIFIEDSYDTGFVHCRELAPGFVNLTGDWARGDDSKQYKHRFYSYNSQSTLRSSV